MEDCSLKDKIKLIFSDVDTEGKKTGTARAAEEYGSACQRMEALYEESEKYLIEKDEDFSFAIEMLCELEELKTELENRVKTRAKSVSSKYGISECKVQRLLTEGEDKSKKMYDDSEQFYGNGPILLEPVKSFISSKSFIESLFDVVANITLNVFPTGRVLLDLVYSQKHRKFQKAEKEGYEQAEEMYINKINELDENLKKIELQDKSSDYYKEKIIQTLHEIAEYELKITVLKILLDI